MAVISSERRESKDLRLLFPFLLQPFMAGAKSSIGRQVEE